MFRLKYAMLFASAFMFMLGNISAMQHQDDDSKKPRMPKFEKDFYSNHYDDSETEEEQGSIIYGTQSSNSQSPNVLTPETRSMEEENLRLLNQYSGTTEDAPEFWRIDNSPRSNSEISETEEMQIEYEPNTPIIVDDNFQFTVIPDEEVMIPVNDRWVRLEFSDLDDCIVGELAITPERNNPEWQELKQLFLDGAFALERFTHDNKIISRAYMRNMSKLYRYMRRHDLLGEFPRIAAFFDRWIALQNRH